LRIARAAGANAALSARLASEPGFLIERLVEPRPVPEAARINRDDYARLNSEPTGFLAIRAVPDPRAV
jgi:hypothetical protein